MSIGYTGLAKDAQQTQDNLNPQNSTFPILLRNNETLIIEEGPTIVLDNDVTGMAIWDNPASTWDGVGTDDQWDSYSAAGNTIVQVSNPRNIFIERFAFTQLIDSASDGVQDTSAKSYTLDSGETLIIKHAYYDIDAANAISTATLNVIADSTTGLITTVSANGGSTYESATLQTTHNFANVGSDLYIQILNPDAEEQFVTSDSLDLVTSDGFNFIVTSSTPASTKTITKVTCEYTL